VKSAGGTALDSIEPLLTELRRIEGLRERKRGVFYKRSAALSISTKTPPAFSRICEARTAGFAFPSIPRQSAINSSAGLPAIA